MNDLAIFLTRAGHVVVEFLEQTVKYSLQWGSTAKVDPALNGYLVKSGEGKQEVAGPYPNVLPG